MAEKKIETEEKMQVKSLEICPNCCGTGESADSSLDEYEECSTCGGSGVVPISK